MKKNLMLISASQTRLTEVCAVLCRSHIDVVYAENEYEVKAGLMMHSLAFILLDFDIKGADFLLSELTSSTHGTHPYILAAARYADSNERAIMLKRGADFCVDNPINAYEVVAVIDAVLRRNRQISVIEFEEMVINISGKKVTMRGKPVPLTRKEYEVLCVLACHAGTVLTKEQIYQAVWKDSHYSKGTHVSDQISSLRVKLGLSSKDTTYICTVFGVGYRFGEAI